MNKLLFLSSWFLASSLYLGYTPYMFDMMLGFVGFSLTLGFGLSQILNKKKLL